MSTNKRYIISADTAQAKKSLTDLSKVLSELSEQPTTFQKNLYNALAKADKEIAGAEGDVNKLNKAFSNLGQSVQKAFTLKDANFGASIKAMFNSLKSEAEDLVIKTSAIKDNLQKLQTANKPLALDVSKSSGDIKQLNQDLSSVKDNIIAVNNAAIKMNNAFAVSTTKLKPITVTSEQLNTVMDELSAGFTKSAQKIAGLSDKAKYAKQNLETIKGEMANIADLNSRLKSIGFEITGIEQNKTKIKELNRQIRQSKKIYEENEAALKVLDTRYAQMQERIRSLRAEYDKLQSRVAGIQALGGVIPKDLAQELKATENALKNTTAELSIYGKEVTKAKASQDALQASITNTINAKKQMQSQTNVKNSDTAALVANYQDTARVARETLQAAMAARTFNAELSKQPTGLRLVSSHFRTLIYDLNAIRIAFILLSSATGIGAALKVIGDFDKSMARVKALMIGAGEATGSLNVEFKAVSDVVQQLGATTKFTAGEVAEGAVIITQAGYDAVDTINALRATLDLSVAGQIEMKEAADTLTKTIAMFNLETTDASHVADLYSAAINYSQTNMHELANAMTYVGSVSRVFGLSLEETAGYLAVLANNGISASKAGTSLRQLMMNIQQPTAKAARVMQKYGLSFEELRAKGMSAEQALRHIVVTLGEAGQLGKVVRITALPSAEIIAKSNDELTEMIDKLDEVDGYAKKVAENNMDNLLDQFVQLKSAVQDTLIRFGEATGLTDGLTNALRNGADGLRSWNTNMADMLTDLAFFASSLILVYKNTRLVSQGMAVAREGGSVFKTRIGQIKDALVGLFTNLKMVFTNLKMVFTNLKMVASAFAAFAIETAVITAAFWAVSKAIEALASRRDLDDVLADHADLFAAAEEGAKRYKDALNAVSVAAANMAPATLESKIKQTEEDIKKLQDEIEKTVNQAGISLSNKRGGYLMQESLKEAFPDFDGLTDTEYQIVAELGDSIPELKGLGDIIREGDVAEIVAAFNSDSVQKALSDALKVKPDLSKPISILDELIRKMEVLQDKANAMKTTQADKELQKLINRLQEYIKDLKAINELQFVPPKILDVAAGAIPDIANFEKFLPYKEFQDVFDKLIEKGGGSLAKLLEFDEKTGFKLEKVNTELESLNSIKKELEMSPLRLTSPEQTNKDIADMDKLINKINAFKTEIEEINNKINQSKFYQVVDKTVKDVAKFQDIEKVENLFKANKSGEAYTKNVASKTGQEFLLEGIKAEMLKAGSIDLGTTIGTTRIDNKPLEEFIADMREANKVKLESLKITEAEYNVREKWLSTLKPALDMGIKSAKGRGKKDRDDDLLGMYYKSQIEIQDRTDGLKGEYEQLLKVHEITKQIEALYERNTGAKQDRKIFKDLIESLETQRELLGEQLKAAATLEGQRANYKHLGEMGAAAGADTGTLSLLQQELDLKEQQLTYENALSNKKLKTNDEVLKQLENQINNTQELYNLNTRMHQLAQDRAIAEANVEKAQNAGLMLNKQFAIYAAKVEASKVKLLELTEQQYTLEKMIAAIENNPDLSNAEVKTRVAELQKEIELLEHRKQLLSQETKKQDPSGLQGLFNANDAALEKFENFSKITETAMGSFYDTVEDMMVDGIMGLLTESEVNWSNYFKNLAKIFLEAALESTIMQGFTKLLDSIGGLISGDLLGKSNDPLSAAGGAAGGAMQNMNDSIMQNAENITPQMMTVMNMTAMETDASSLIATNFNAGAMTADTMTAGNFNTGAMNLQTMTGGNVNSGAISMTNGTLGNTNAGVITMTSATLANLNGLAITPKTMTVANLNAAMVVQSGGTGGMGGMMARGGVIPAASGNIVKSPTNLTNGKKNYRVGEAGAEAIMPVKRLSNGKYGIETDGAGSGVTNQNDFSIHLTMAGSSGNKQEDEEQMKQMTSQIKLLINSQVAKFFRQEQRQGGMLYKQRTQ